MPRDLFGDVTGQFAGAGGRSRFTVPISLTAHTVVLAAVVVVPLLATDALPVLQSRIVYRQFTPVVPPPPPPPREFRPPQPVQAGDAGVPPREVPTGIAPEPPDVPPPIAAEVGLVPGGIENGTGVLTPPPPPPPPPDPPKTVRVGVVKAPAKLHDVAPVYPAIAQAARVQGVVIIQATIGIDGRVVDATVLRSVPLLDVAAIEAVRQWRYTPSTLNGQPVAVVMTVTVHFMLQ